MPAPSLQSMLVEPTDGWQGGRALIAHTFIPPAQWLESPELRRPGEPQLSPLGMVATDRTTLGHWSVRDDQIVTFWLPEGALSVPAWVDVDMTYLYQDGNSRTLTVTVSADAVLLGGDVRVSGSILAAQCIADAMDAMLPTFGIVNAAWLAAGTKLPPHDLVPTPVSTSEMMSVAAWLLEETLIQGSLADWYSAWVTNPTTLKGGEVLGLIRTIGKEYVLHPGLAQKPNAGTMYGWQELDGRAQQSPINGASFFHEATYFDYSQRITLVKKMARLNGQAVALADVYQHYPELVMGGRPGAVPIRHPLVPLVAA